MSDNSDKIILDLCGGTGSWSKPYKEAGYDVRLITLPDYEVENVTFADTAILFHRASGGFTAVRYDKVHGILAAPPCTEFSIAKTTAPRNFAKGMATVRACMEIVWQCQSYGKLKFWALENPRGLLVRFLGNPAYRFEQWQFGGAIEKPTCVWGIFNKPASIVTQKPHIDKFRNKVDDRNLNSREYANPSCPDEYKEYVSQLTGYKAKRAALRAITPPGFAQAFYKANK